MFWWCCADFSNMAGLFGSGTTKKEDGTTTATNDQDGRRRRWWGWSGGEKIAATTPATDWHQRQQFFESIFTYTATSAEEEEENQRHNGTHDGTSFAERLLFASCTVLSSVFLLITLPFSLPFSLKFIGPSERLVVMRLGRTKGVHGPGGTVLVLPWVDRATSVDLRVSGNELPLIQVLSADHGTAELAVTVFSQVTDPLVAHCAIKNVRETLHSLAYTTVCRRLGKLLLSDLTSARSLEKALAHCQEELNTFVTPRGVSVTRVVATRLSVLKAADSGGAAMSVLRTLARSQFGQQLVDQLGTAFSPQQQQRQCHAPPPPPSSVLTPEVIIGHQQQQQDTNSCRYGGNEEAAQPPPPPPPLLGEKTKWNAAAPSTNNNNNNNNAYASLPLSPILEETASTTDIGGVAAGVVVAAAFDQQQREHQQHQRQHHQLMDADLVALLERIRSALCPSLAECVGRLFRVRCQLVTPSVTSSSCNTTPTTAAVSMTPSVVEFDIDLRTGNECWCGWTWERTIGGAAHSPAAVQQCDVMFTLQKGTLLALLDGSMSPLCAYLEGRVQIDGSMQDAALLKHLADALITTQKQQQQATTTTTTTPPIASADGRGKQQPKRATSTTVVGRQQRGWTATTTLTDWDRANNSGRIVHI